MCWCIIFKYLNYWKSTLKMWNHKNLKATFGLFFYPLKRRHVFLKEILELFIGEHVYNIPHLCNPRREVIMWEWITIPTTQYGFKFTFNYVKCYIYTRFFWQNVFVFSYVELRKCIFFAIAWMICILGTFSGAFLIKTVF